MMFTNEEIKRQFEEYQLQVQSMYDEYLQKTEGRGASYGELAHIQSLNEKELTELEQELEGVLYNYDE